MKSVMGANEKSYTKTAIINRKSDIPEHFLEGVDKIYFPNAEKQSESIVYGWYKEYPALVQIDENSIKITQNMRYGGYSRAFYDVVSSGS